MHNPNPTPLTADDAEQIGRKDARPLISIGQRTRRFLSGSTRRAWVLAAAWSALIWVANTRPETVGTQHDTLNYVIWQGGHLISHIILGALVWNAATLTWKHSTGFFVALLGGCCHAVLDEWVQTLVPSRHANLEDVLYNVGGVALGIAVVEFIRLRSQAIRR